MSVTLNKFNLKVILSIWIYFGWFGCVYFGTKSLDVVTLLFPIISWTLLTVTFQVNLKLIFKLLALLLVGLTFDFISSITNLIQFNHELTSGIIPLWLISIWLLFISSLPLIQSLIERKYALASIFGAVFGPISYYAGNKFGVLNFDGMLTFSIYSCFWAIYTPGAICLMNLKDHKNEN